MILSHEWREFYLFVCTNRAVYLFDHVEQEEAFASMMRRGQIDDIRNMSVTEVSEEVFESLLPHVGPSYILRGDS